MKKGGFTHLAAACASLLLIGALAVKNPQPLLGADPGDGSGPHGNSHSLTTHGPSHECVLLPDDRRSGDGDRFRKADARHLPGTAVGDTALPGPALELRSSRLGGEVFTTSPKAAPEPFLYRQCLPNPP